MAPVIETHNIIEETGTLASPYDQVVSVPTHNAGDLLIAILGSDAARTIDSAPAGWTLLASETAAGSATNYIYWKIAGASEPASYTWSWNQDGDRVVGMLVISGAADPAVNAIESATAGDGGSGGTTTSPAVTPSDADSLVIRTVVSRRNSTLTPPAGETLLTTLNTAVLFSASYFTHGATSTGTNDWTYTPTWHDDWAHVVFAVAPAAGSGLLLPMLMRA